MHFPPPGRFHAWTSEPQHFTQTSSVPSPGFCHLPQHVPQLPQLPQCMSQLPGSHSSSALSPRATHKHLFWRHPTKFHKCGELLGATWQEYDTGSWQGSQRRQECNFRLEQGSKFRHVYYFGLGQGSGFRYLGHPGKSLDTVYCLGCSLILCIYCTA